MIRLSCLYFSILAAVSGTGATAELDLAKVKATTEGFCTGDVLSIASGAVARQKSAAEKAFVRHGIFRAREIYLSSTLPYVEGAKPNEIKVSDVQFKRVDSFSGDRNQMALVVTLDRQSDEDQVTFYFKKGATKPELLLALHNEQSAVGIWACE